MIPQDEINQLVSNYQAPTSAGRKTPTVKSKGILGFLERNAPTVGGVLGGIIAAPLDPLTGGAASVGAAALGSAAGQALKNHDEGQSITNDLVGSAVSGGTGQFGGKILGKVLGGTVGKAFTKGTKGVVNNAVTRTAEKQAVTNAEPFMTVNKGIRQSNDLNGTLNHLQGLGVTPTVDNMHNAAGLVTGNNGIISGTTRQLLANSGQVSTDSIMSTAKSALQKEAGQGIGDVSQRGTPANHILASIRQTVENIGNDGEGSITGKAEANNLLDTVQSMENRISDLGGIRATGTNGAEARALQLTKQDIMDKLGAATDQSVKDFKFAPEDEQAIHNAVSKAGLPTSLAEHIINNTNDAKSLQALRSVQAPFVKASTLARAADDAAGGVLPKVAGGSGSVNDAANLVGSAALGSRIGLARHAGNLLDTAATSAPVVKTAEIAGRGAGILNKVVPGGTGNAAADVLAQTLTHQTPSTGATPDTNPVASPTDSLLGAPDTSGQSSDVPESDTTYTQQQLINDINNDPKNASTYINLYKTLQPSSASAVSKPTAQNAGTAESGLGSLQQLATLIQQDPSLITKAATPGQGIPLVGGFVTRATGAGSYEDVANNVLDSLARLRTGAAMSKTEQKFYQNLLPKAGDSEDTISQKLLTLENAFNSYAGKS